MIDRARLLSDLQGATKSLIDDLRDRTDEVDEVRTLVRQQYQAASDAGRTDRSYEEWREDLLAQVAVGWVLATVFVRFCEDNGLFDKPLISGPGSRRDLARDHRADWLARNPTEGDRGWLQEVFRRYRALPATGDVFGEHNALWLFGPTDDGAKALLELWWEVDVESGDLVRDFTDPALDTRFLGDLYQDLSDHAKKNYALLQTPEFVEEFILDRTLDPAIETFGLAEVKLIDPTCGSGHFLLGAFERLHHRWREREPATSQRELAQRALDAVHGVDLNPFAVAIARFRLLVAAMKASGISKIADAPDFHLHLAVGDSLIHGRRSGDLFSGTAGLDPVLQHRYPTEDEEEANRILEPGRYHAVVGNPPYINAPDPALNQAYRGLYETCHRQYSLVAPFLERFFDLAVATNTEAGFVGMIAANSFMKRQFGTKLVREYLPTKDLTHVIDTSGAYIPGHGTPTVILFARHRAPRLKAIRSVLGIRGEPGRPKNPRLGKVWRSVVELVDQPGEENDFVSSHDMPRDRFSDHPWSLQGGEAPRLKADMEDRSARVLAELVRLIGYTGQTNADPVFLAPREAFNRRGIDRHLSRRIVVGESIRDWKLTPGDHALFPYDLETQELIDIAEAPRLLRAMWPWRTTLGTRRTFSKQTYFEEGRPWWEWHQIALDRVLDNSLMFAFVATHNHFLMDRGGRLTKQSAMVIKLPEGATEDDHLRLLGLLNSSTACFWMKQVFHGKGQGGVGQESRAEWEEFIEHDGTKLKQFPIPSSAPLERARALDALAQQLDETLPSAVLEREPPTRAALASARERAASLRGQMVALQEELDWECYHLYGLTDRNLALPTDEIPELALGERAFEIALARAMKDGRVKSTWFSRHGSTPVTELPTHWSEGYRQRVEERLALIASDRKLRLLERPEYKRRWNWDDWQELEQEAIRSWLLDRLERLECWQQHELQTVGRLADHLRRDADAVQAAHLLAGRSDVDLAALVGTLVADEAVPHAAAYRFKPSGMRKRWEWERVWELQRAEDEIEARKELPPEDPQHLSEAEADRLRTEQGLDRIPVPPKYTKGDFRDDVAWRHRGKLDVPKERFIRYPGTHIGADSTAVVGWAGWDHLAQARALSGQFQRRKDEGADVAELEPLLVGLHELVPWLVQWHNQPDPQSGYRMGEFFEAYVDTEARGLGLTTDDLRSWTP